jgi:hypothetical protein
MATKEIYGMKEAAAEIGVPYIRLWRANNAGKIPASKKVGKSYYFTAEEIRWLKHHFATAGK